MVIRIALLLLCALLTAQQSSVWRTEEGVWAQAVRVSPFKPGPHLSLGLAYQRQHRFAEARAQYGTALTVSKRWRDARQFEFATAFNTAKILASEGHLDRALLLLKAMEDQFPDMMANIEYSAQSIRSQP